MFFGTIMNYGDSDIQKSRVYTNEREENFIGRVKYICELLVELEILMWFERQRVDVGGFSIVHEI